MIPVRLICASSDLERAKSIEHLLGVEGFDVQITTRRLPDEPDADEEDESARECGVVLWSQNSVDSWPVLELAEEMHSSRSLVQVALDPVASSIPSYAGPIDFKGWSGERDSAWSMLRTRIDLIEHGGEPTGAPLGSVAALGLASLSILSIAVSDRVGEGPAPSLTPSPEPLQFASVVDERAQIAIGGPTILEPELDTLLVEPVQMAPLRLYLPPLPNLEAPASLPDMEIKRPGFLRRVLNKIASIGDGDDDEAST